MENCSIYEKTRINLAVLIDFIMERLKTFTVGDYAVFKVCIFSLGALVGAVYSKTIKKCAPVIAVISILSYGYLIYKMFFKED